MPQTPRAEEQRNFIETCVELEMLSETDADSLSEVIADERKFVSQTAVERGLLTPADVDIVQSLRNPTEIVPGYKLLELVGRGGMGVVYRALQLDLERIVALKIILISNVHDPTVAARFEREAKALARLQHPNIVQAHNFGKHEGRYYFSMEFVPGRTCEQALREDGIMTPRDVWSIARQVASGLLHALRQNLIHRDIKPANLILVPPPEGSPTDAEIVKVADFGLAMFADQSSEQLKLTTGDKVMGSPAYMSLEQFGGRQVDFRSDMYSLGATAWHLLFGKPPLRGGSIAALFQQKSEPLVFDPAELPVALPEEQMRLLMGLLDPNPDRRPQSYEQLIDAIDAFGLDPVVSDKWVSSSPAGESAQPGLVSAQPTLRVDSQASEPQAAGLPATSQDISQSGPIGEAMPPTIELPQSVLEPRPSRRTIASRFKPLIAIAAAVSLFAAILGILSQRTAPRGVRTHTRVVGNTPLFDGVTLSGWDVGGSMVGAWNTVQAPDSSTALGCMTRQGALTRRYPETRHPRISLFVWLREESGPVDVDFALDPTESSDLRGCLRLSGKTNQLGQKASDFGDLDVSVTSDALPTVYDRFHVIHIERQPTDWFVFLEEQFIGSVPIAQVGNGTAIRLVVHDGQAKNTSGSQAFFADVQLYELGQSEGSLE